MYVEFYVEGELLQTALRATADLDIVVHELGSGNTTPLRFFVVANGHGIDEFEDNLESDDTVAEFSCMNSDTADRMFQIVAEPGTVEQTLYEQFIDLGGVFHSATNADGAWYTKMNFPDRDAFRRYQSVAEAHGSALQPTIMRDEKFFLPDRVFGLTEKQRELLSEAVKAGYFEVPRRASLSDIADAVGISDQAASERLRRGMRTIAESGVSWPTARRSAARGD